MNLARVYSYSCPISLPALIISVYQVIVLGLQLTSSLRLCHKHQPYPRCQDMVVDPTIDTATSHPTEAVVRVVAEEASMEVEEEEAAAAAVVAVDLAAEDVVVVAIPWVNLVQV